MTVQLPIADFSPEQRELWTRVDALWAWSRDGDTERIRAALHPRYVGWDLNTPLPHDRDDAVRSVSDEAPALRDYQLRPLSVEVYDGRVGVVHYTYTATAGAQGEPPATITGRWSEVYLREGGEWTLVSVSGRPDLA